MTMPSADSSDAASIRSQLQRILSSDAFSSAPILSRFLDYVVRHKIDPAQTPLKEYTIGVDVFQRGTGFDPRVDTIVRVHARRLRKRLDRYYETEGLADPLRITMPKGHYHAAVVTRPSAIRAQKNETAPSVRQSHEARVGHEVFRSNVIPAPRTPLIGRAGEVAELQELLTDNDGPRLVTLTGTAGSGKTRLMTEVGLRLQKQLSGEIVFVRLASIADAQTLQLALLRAFGLHATDNAEPLETLCRHLHGLGHAPPLILDNFEQLAESAPLIGWLLDACMSLRVLVTSRVALHLYGECEYPVAPLELPESDLMSAEQLATVPSVELFVQRAAAVRPGFSLGPANATAVARICRRFDGLPLGIELAAAQCRVLTPMQLLERYRERLDLPAGNVVDVPDRQRTLRNAIEWSHELLTEPERKLCRRLSVFSGGFTPEAAEAVANVRDDLGTAVEAGITRLLDNNLLQTVPDADEPRCTMLETIREYCLEQLAESGESAHVHKAHAAYCLVLAEEGIKRLEGKARKDWLTRCDQEQDNVHAALTWLVESGDGQWALRLVRALYLYWDRREHIELAHRLILSVLERFEPSINPALWSQVACHAGAMEGRMGRQKAAYAHAERGLAVARECGDRTMEIMALNTIAVFDSFAQRYADAVNRYEECLHLCEASDSEAEIAAALSNLAVSRLALGEHEQARRLMERALELFKNQEEWIPVAWCLNQLGDIAMVAGHHDEAEEHYRHSAHRFLQLGDFLGIARCWTDLGQLALMQGAYAKAASCFADALRINSRQGSQRGVANLIEGCAALAVAEKNFRQGLVLAGAAQAMRAARNMVAYPYQQARLDKALQPARETLAPAQIADCHERGMAMTAVEAIAYVQWCLIGSEPDMSIES